MDQGIVRQYVTKENIRKKNRIDFVMKSIFTSATFLSSSFALTLSCSAKYDAAVTWTKRIKISVAPYRPNFKTLGLLIKADISPSELCLPKNFFLKFAESI